MRRAIALAMLLLVASIAPVAASQTSNDAFAEWANQDHCEYFEQTDTYLCFGFKSYWHDYGGLEIFGYPITNEIQEDGLTVQYFERARFEWHPGVWPERHDVLQGLLGVEIAADMDDHDAFTPVDADKDDCEYFSLTGHNVCGNFLDRWNMSGGLPVFGYPISEAFEDENGMLIQFFERQVMEYQPGVWPERHDVLFRLIGLEVWETRGEPEPEPQPELSVVADDLVQPRGMLYTDDGLYIAEAGAGGDGACIVLGSGATGCFGESSALTLLDEEGQSRVIDGVASLVEDTGEGIGIHDVALDDDGNIYVVVGLGADPNLRADLGPDATTLGTVIQIDSEGGYTVVADLAEFEQVNNPDGSDPPDSNPYGIAWDGQDLIVADAGANNVLRVSLDGSVEVVAVLPPVMVEPPPFPPFDQMPEMPMESVPTNVAIGPDGNYYVSQLTGFPFPAGGANIFQITPDGDVEIYAEGFTALGDLAFDADGNLWALEILAGGLLAADPDDPSSLASRIVKVAPDGTQTDYMFQGMAFATGIAVGSAGEIYVANLAVTPDAHVLRIDLP